MRRNGPSFAADPTRPPANVVRPSGSAAGPPSRNCSECAASRAMTRARRSGRSGHAASRYSARSSGSRWSASPYSRRRSFESSPPMRRPNGSVLSSNGKRNSRGRIHAVLHLLRLVAGLVLLIASPSPSAAQSREAEVIKQQEEKEKAAEAYRPNRLETFLSQVEQGKWLFGVPRGWYIGTGSVYPGGGFTIGGGYRQYIGYDSYVDANVLLSRRSYKKVGLRGFTPNHFKGRIDLEGSVAWLDATQVAFYGLGPDSTSDDRATFRINRAYVEGVAVTRPFKWLGIRFEGGFDDYTQKPGFGRAPSIEEIYTPETAPLLGDDPLYLRGEASASIYWQRPPGYSRRGGSYTFAYEEFNPLRGEGGTFGFARQKLVQPVRIRRETWVLSLRGASESILRKSDVVPYFLMPSLGGGDSLRGYATDRLRDRHTLLLSGELRWFPNRLGLDMALFMDAGTVSPLRSDLALGNMKIDYGVGVRFHTPAATVLRFDVAKGSEGLRLVFAGGPVF